MTTSLHPKSNPTGYLALLRENSNYRSIWIGEVISLFGDWFNLIASAALISQLTSSGLAIGGLFVIRMLAPFLVSPLAGVAADRFNRKWLLIGADLSRAVVVMGFLLVRQPQHVWLLYTLTAIQLGISGFFYPAKNAILPDIVHPKGLGTANALSSTTWSVMLAAGAAVGGVVAGAWGIYSSFVIDGLTFLLSAYFISKVSYQARAKPDPSSTTIAAFNRQFIEGLRYLGKEPDILAITLHKAAAALTVGGAIQIVQVALAEQVFVIGDGGSTSLGLMFAVAGAGTGLGPIIARLVTGDRDKSLRIALALSYAMTTIGLAISAPLASFGLVLIGFLIRTVGGGINWVFSTQLLLQTLPARVRGRIFSTEFAVFTLASAIGSALGGWIFDNTAITISTFIWWLAIISLLPGVIWTLWMVSGHMSSQRRPDAQVELDVETVSEIETLTPHG